MTAVGAVMFATGCPLTSTRGCVGEMVAGARCVHCTTALT